MDDAKMSFAKHAIDTGRVTKGMRIWPRAPKCGGNRGSVPSSAAATVLMMAEEQSLASRILEAELDAILARVAAAA